MDVSSRSIEIECWSEERMGIKWLVF
jgi:hypothetical protein